MNGVRWGFVKRTTVDRSDSRWNWQRTGSSTSWGYTLLPAVTSVTPKPWAFLFPLSNNEDDFHRVDLLSYFLSFNASFSLCQEIGLHSDPALTIARKVVHKKI